MVLDTLPAGWSVDRNSIRGLHGIDSISVAGNVVMARCSERDTLAQLMFSVETGSGDAAAHTFVVVRNAGTAQAVVERARPIFFRVRQKEQ